MRAAGNRPLLLTGTVSLLAWQGLVLAVDRGWLGADVDRGAQFCEASGTGPWLQPVSALSNLGFTVAALAIAVRASRRGSAMGPLAAAYAVLVTLLGPGSAAMHATETAWGGTLDTLSMYLVASFIAGYALTRLLHWSPAGFAAVFLAMVLGCETLARTVGPVPLVQTAGNAAFGGLLVLALVIEFRLSAREGRPRRWGLAAVAALLLAFAVWTQAQDGSPWCDPHSFWQGHGIWHALCALSCWLLYRYYDDTDASSATS